MEGLADVPQLGLRRLEKLAADRRVVEQVADLDGRARRSTAGGNPSGNAADDLDFGPGGILAVRLRIASRLISADRRQGLAAEAERGDAEQVVGGGELARGVGGDG